MGRVPERLNFATGALPTCKEAIHIPGGQRPRDGDNPPPEEAGFGHTDHAPTAAAAPTPCACTGTVAERIKAQDATNTVSDQHHLSEKVGQLRGFVTTQMGTQLQGYWMLPGSVSNP